MIPVIMMGASKKFVLVIDAGHGGKDAGAVGSFSKEKDINLKTALAFGRYVERNCPDVKVIYTRKTDVFLELYERANIANKNHADVFVSIHTNALPKGHISRGVETYSMTLRRSEEKLSVAQRENSVITYEKDYEQHYAGYDSNSAESSIMFEYIHDENMARSVELSKCIQKNLCSTASRPDKGVKQDNFHVLRRTSMPACLVELGFISTPDEEQLLNNDASIDKMALGIYKGFLQYKSKRGDDATSYEPAPNVDIPVQPTVAERKDAEPKPVKVEKRTEQVQEKLAVAQQDANKENKASVSIEMSTDYPVFKIQFLTSPRIIKEGSSQFKGIKDVSYYKDGSTYKFTIGEYESFSGANARKKEISELFPDAFVVAFRNGQRMDLNEARKLAKSK